MLLTSFPTHELLPHGLTREELADPYSVIDDFFSCYHLPQVRQEHKELLRTLVTGRYNHSLDRKERSDLVYYHERLEKVIEAIHIIHEQRQKQKDQIK
jgi:hypothetical protein